MFIYLISIKPRSQEVGSTAVVQGWAGVVVQRWVSDWFLRVKKFLNLFVLLLAVGLS